MIGLLSLGVMVGCKTEESVDVCVTDLVVRNGDSLPVVVWLTLGAGDTADWEQSVDGMFGIEGNGLVGKFVLGAGKSVRYRSEKGIMGMFCFNDQAYQCDGDSLFTGSTLTEFCLNNYGSVENAQETVDISCVAGVSYLASIDMCGGGVWTANYPGFEDVNRIENGVFGENSGRVGVYPVGCDDCVSSVNPPECVKGKGERPQKEAICQVQRNAKKSGGCVTVTYLGKPYQICK